MNARTLGIEVGAATGCGRRKINADAFVIDELGGLLAVADGMGDDGRAACVARMALHAVRERFAPPWSLLPPKERGANEAAERFVRGVVAAHQRVHASQTPDAPRTGATFAGVAICGDALSVAHIGDSRVYLVAGGTGTPARLTEDHTLLAELVLRGVPPDVAADVRNAHALTRAIGVKEPVQVEPFAVRWARGDVVVVCTDGVSDELDAAALGRAIDGVADVERAAACIVEAANAAGGWDNATAIVARRVV